MDFRTEEKCTRLAEWDESVDQDISRIEDVVMSACEQSIQIEVEGLKQRQDITDTWIGGLKKNPGVWDFYLITWNMLLWIQDPLVRMHQKLISQEERFQSCNLKMWG